MAGNQDASLDEMARLLALLQRRPPAGLWHPSDWGCQDTSDAYQALLAEVGVIVRMSRMGTCSDNAVRESPKWVTLTSSSSTICVIAAGVEGNREDATPCLSRTY
jgi:hypothetical protein